MPATDDAPVPRLKILMTEGSSTSARQALYAIGPHHTIDILDPSALCQCRFSRYVRRWYRCPPFSADPLGYMSVLRQRLDDGDYDVLLPVHEQIYLLSRYRHLLQSRVAVALPQFSDLERLINKANFCRLLSELDLPQPEVTIARSRYDLEQIERLPCYIKLDYSTAGQGVRLVRHRQELSSAVQHFEESGWLSGRHEILVQQPAAGEKGSITGLFQHGRLISAHCVKARAIGVGGSSMGQVSNWQPRARDDLVRLGEHLQWHGAMMVEFLYDAATEQPQYIECNPRIGETSNSWLSGVDVCGQLLQLSLEQPLTEQPPNRSGVRTHQGFLVLMAQAINGASRRQLLAELLRNFRGIGLYQDSQDEMTRPREDPLSLIPAVWVALRLLARPAAAQKLVGKTVANYSLSVEAAQRIRGLPVELE